MCGRFTLFTPKKIPDRFKVTKEPTLFEASYNIAPSQTILTVVRNSPNRIQLMKWGFLFSPKKPFGTINIREESTQEKPYFKHILLRQRCIIPSNGFYEWRTVNLEGKDEKYPFFISMKNRELFGFAGLYNKFNDAEGKPYYTCAILTCEPNSLVKTVHHRMPVMLEEKFEEDWLNPDNDDESLQKMLKPYPPKQMKLHPVSRRVNKPMNDDKKLIDEFVEARLF